MKMGMETKKKNSKGEKKTKKEKKKVECSYT